jgi:hypothetical protein
LAAFAAVVAGQLLVLPVATLFSRDFWLDEIYTHTLVADPDMAHAGRALAAGVETHPPALYLLLRAFTFVAGACDEVTLRALALLSVGLGLAGVYCCLRGAFAAPASLAAVLLLWCHPLVEAHAFEARFYGPWLAGLVWFAFFLARCRAGGGGWSARLGAAACAVFVCTVHYLGILSLGLVVAGELVARRLAGMPLRGGLASAALGPLALAACLPLLARQRTALTVATWVPPATAERSLAFLKDIFLDPYLVPLVVTVWVFFLVRDVRSGGGGAGGLLPLAGLTALLLFPLALVTFSWVAQSVLEPRYALVAAAGLGPAAASLLAPLPRRWAWAVSAYLVVVSALGLSALASRYREEDGKTRELIAALRAGTDAADVIFESPVRMYVVCRYAPDLARRCYLMDFERGDFRPIHDSRLFVRDLARRYAEYYSPTSLRPWRSLRGLPRFYLVPTFFGRGAPEGGVYPSPYPGFLFRPVKQDLLLEMVKPGPADGG